MEHPLRHSAPLFAHHNEHPGAMFEQQLASGYSYAWSHSFDPYSAATFDQEATPSLHFDPSQFCSLPSDHADGHFYPASGMHGQHRESVYSNNLDMEPRFIFPTESWSSLCSQNRAGSPVDTVSSSKSSHPHSPLPQVMPSCTLAMQHYTSSSLQHIDRPSVFFQEAEPIAILPSQYAETDLEACHVDNLEDKPEAAAPLARQVKSEDMSIEQEGSGDEYELSWRQREKSDGDSDYTPRPSASRRRSQAPRGKGQSAATPRSKVAKRSAVRHTTSQIPHRTTFATNAQRFGRGEGECERRAFTCLGRPYGCQTTFTSKNEWKRHVISQHLCLGYWRCDLCPVDREKCPNDFNRKDLFTQHLRRMHTPASTTGTVVAAPSSKTTVRRSKVRAKPSPEDEAFAREIERIRERCWVQARQPPSHLECTFCQQTFKGDGACLEDFLEHVGRHLAVAPGEQRSQRDNEQRHGANSVAFQKNETLRQWLVSNGLLRRTSGRWELCNPTTAGTCTTSSSWGSADAEGDPE